MDIIAMSGGVDSGVALLLSKEKLGLDVLGGTPEGTSLLDGMVDYVRSDAFAPTSDERK